MKKHVLTALAITISIAMHASDGLTEKNKNSNQGKKIHLKTKRTKPYFCPNGGKNFSYKLNTHKKKNNERKPPALLPSYKSHPLS